jgi:hypothetical protein
MVRCKECDQLVRMVDPETGCRPWLAEHRTPNGKRKCDGSLTGQFVEEGPMAEQNEDLSVAGGNRLEHGRKVKAFLATLAPEVKFSAARDAADAAGLTLTEQLFYRYRSANAAVQGRPAPRASEPPQQANRLLAATMLQSIDDLRELGQIVKRLGGFEAARTALVFLEELTATAGGAP